ncbi:hypothetical protein TNCV_466621 [Trichonephila clavipes]|uniref:Uncharacterized protein n=1 Tax=Trichonephila clavipes TaxID=2585209 RepID=A0A8X6UXH3_TRICX|nr:hypothetical protein TNCV_466621 [Trichonephila clavipes]
MARQTSGEALETTRSELTHLRILWDLEHKEDHQKVHIDDVENDLNTENIKKVAESCCVSMELRKRVVSSQDL